MVNFTAEEGQQLRNHIEGIGKILGIKSEDVLSTLLFGLDDHIMGSDYLTPKEQHDIASAFYKAYLFASAEGEHDNTLSMQSL